MSTLSIKSEISNVSVGLKANVYFDGGVTSRAITLADGSVKTLGLMLPGEYEFGTEVHELMEISTGNLEALLPQATSWVTITDDMSFEVPVGETFKVKVHQVTNYCCSYGAK